MPVMQQGWEVIDVAALLAEMEKSVLEVAVILQVMPLTVTRWRDKGRMRTRDIKQLREHVPENAPKQTSSSSDSDRHVVTLVFKKGTTADFAREFAEHLAEGYPMYLYEVEVAERHTFIPEGR